MLEKKKRIIWITWKALWLGWFNTRMHFEGNNFWSDYLMQAMHLFVYCDTKCNWKVEPEVCTFVLCSKIHIARSSHRIVLVEFFGKHNNHYVGFKFKLKAFKSPFQKSSISRSMGRSYKNQSERDINCINTVNCRINLQNLPVTS